MDLKNQHDSIDLFCLCQILQNFGQLKIQLSAADGLCHLGNMHPSLSSSVSWTTHRSVPSVILNFFFVFSELLFYFLEG